MKTNFIKYCYSFLIILLLHNVVLAQDSTCAKLNPIVTSLQNYTVIEKKIDEIKETLKDQDSKKDLVNLFTIIVAALAVVVSLISAFLNYKVFKGQSISSFRKNWNNGLIEELREFMVISSNLFGSLKSGTLPPNCEAEIIQLKKINYSIAFKLHEIDCSDKAINDLMFKTITLIDGAKKNPASVTADTFDGCILEISNKANELLKSNWKSITNFK